MTPEPTDHGALMTHCIGATDRCYLGGPCPYCEALWPPRYEDGTFAPRPEGGSMTPVTIVIWPENYLEAPGQPIITQVVRRPEVWEENLTLEDLKVALKLMEGHRGHGYTPWQIVDAMYRLRKALEPLDK